MTPRAFVPDTGLRGPGQEIWSEQAKEAIRSMVFEKEYVQVLRNAEEEDEGGSRDDDYQPEGEPVAGRIDMVGNNTGVTAVFGEQLAEATTHVVSMEPDADVTSKDRIEVEGRTYIITSDPLRTNEATTHLQVKELHG